jgi:hypothetical protein
LASQQQSFGFLESAPNEFLIDDDFMPLRSLNVLLFRDLIELIAQDYVIQKPQHPSGQNVFTSPWLSSRPFD